MVVAAVMAAHQNMDCAWGHQNSVAGQADGQSGISGAHYSHNTTSSLSRSCRQHAAPPLGWWRAIPQIIGVFLKACRRCRRLSKSIRFSFSCFHQEKSIILGGAAVEPEVFPSAVVVRTYVHDCAHRKTSRLRKYNPCCCPKRATGKN